MEYSDNLIASAEDFAKMAKEYTSRLEEEKRCNNLSEINQTTINGTHGHLKSLIWLYGYIKRNIRNAKLKKVFLEMEEGCKSDLKVIEEKYFARGPQVNIRRNQRLNNLNSCLKLVIFYEAELVKSFVEFMQQTNGESLFEIAVKHLEFIKKISSI